MPIRTMPTGWAAVRADRQQGGCKGAGGVAVGALAEDDIQQEQAGVGVGSLLAQALHSQAVVDHRVQPADRELVGAEIEHRVAPTGGEAGQRLDAGQGQIGVQRPEVESQAHQQLGGERAAGEQCAHRSAGRLGGRRG